MKKLNLTVLLLGAALFTGLGAVSVSASDMKCGAGKCGGNMEKPMKKGMMEDKEEMMEKMKEKKKGMMEDKEDMMEKMKDKKKGMMEDKEDMMEKMKDKKKEMMEHKAMKCGKGKCGGN